MSDLCCCLTHAFIKKDCKYGSFFRSNSNFDNFFSKYNMLKKNMLKNVNVKQNKLQTYPLSASKYIFQIDFYWIKHIGACAAGWLYVENGGGFQFLFI